MNPTIYERKHRRRRQNRSTISSHHMTGTVAVIGALGIICLAITSCKKFVQIPDAPNKLPTSAIFADSADATQAVLGLYIQMMAISSTPQFINGEITIYTGLAGDELYPSNPPSSDALQFYANGISPQNSEDAIFWTTAYPAIYQANACIEGLNESTTLSQSVKNQLLGEAMVFRALQYFHLVNLFGGVPLVTSTNYTVNAGLPRASSDSIYAQITADLKSAESLLTPSYPSAGSVRPNQLTASALLAKAYLYQKQWASAETEAQKVINSGLYSLQSDPNQVFVAGSSEAIWQLPPLQQSYETSEGFNFIPGFGINPPDGIVPAFSVSTNLVHSFEPGDLRFTDWLDSSTVSGTTYYYPVKYKLAYDRNTTPLENYMIIRLAEVYLILAEAEAQQSNADALTNLNTVRARAKLGPYMGPTDQNSVLTAIYQERRIELFCELGNRWYDLKRTGLLNAVMDTVTPAKGGSWTSQMSLFPIPYQQLLSNPALSQNSGY